MDAVNIFINVQIIDDGGGGGGDGRRLSQTYRHNHHRMVDIFQRRLLFPI